MSSIRVSKRVVQSLATVARLTPGLFSRHSIVYEVGPELRLGLVKSIWDGSLSMYGKFARFGVSDSNGTAEIGTTQSKATLRMRHTSMSSIRSTQRVRI